ncbi:hypothetical protein CKM354_000636400 [Cercospora kikuchii]|uniref:C2H2-type domain-containing protein n=1 Tax=Cercospora kikuchii TaxID=84275 RepID=A0A9P3FHQ6_9PEZI|nr:uncharacterized protein CKM354_000636400 [Cercospora kikuchii]GIZ43124.1 hypothetical protein CKM354_000636400 [Cercospora kikuchii]
MDFTWDNIDPQLLLTQLGTTFTNDDLPTGDHGQRVNGGVAQSLDQDVDMGMELDAREDSVHLPSDIQERDTDHRVGHQMKQDAEPSTPQRLSCSQQNFNPEAPDFHPTPPLSAQVNENTIYPALSWHHHNHYGVLSNAGSETSPYHGSYSFVDEADFLTPVSASVSQFDGAHHVAMVGSPTPVAFPPLHSGQHLSPHAAQPPPPMNMYGVPADVPARDNMDQWAAGASSVPMTAARNDGQTLSPERHRTRAVSVSSMGAGDFICDGSPDKPCGKRFATRSKMTHHARCHKAPRKFCTLCSAGFYYEKDLKRHMKTHGPRDRHLVCNNIGCPYRTKPFARKDHRDRHLRSCHHSQA